MFDINRRMHYSKAPITEAILELRVDPPIQASHFADLFNAEKERYPTQQELIEFRTELDPADPLASKTQRINAGCAFSSVDRLQVWHAKPEAFSFGRLAPYQDWIHFRDEARRIWTLYRAATNPTRLV